MPSSSLCFQGIQFQELFELESKHAFCTLQMFQQTITHHCFSGVQCTVALIQQSTACQMSGCYDSNKLVIPLKQMF